MDKQQYRIIQKSVRKFYKGLDLDEVKAYLIKEGIFLKSSYKLDKGENINKGLALLPSSLSGKNLCGNDGKCKYHCLAFSGQNPRSTASSIDTGNYILSGSIRNLAKRTYLLLHDKEFFFELLNHDITRWQMQAKINKSKLGIRLNTYSDLDWQYYTDTRKDVMFYDYTKYWNRKSTENHKYTFSYSEKVSDLQLHEKIEQGENVAMVFRKDIPSDYQGIKVISGDNNDDRYDDVHGVIVGLKLKQSVKGYNEELLKDFVIATA